MTIFHYISSSASTVEQAWLLPQSVTTVLTYFYYFSSRGIEAQFVPRNLDTPMVIHSYKVRAGERQCPQPYKFWLANGRGRVVVEDYSTVGTMGDVVEVVEHKGLQIQFEQQKWLN